MGRFVGTPARPAEGDRPVRGVGLSKHKIGCIYVGFEWTDDEQILLEELHELVLGAFQTLANLVCLDG